MSALEDALRRGWLSLITESIGQAIRPAETPTVHASGPFPHRMLLVGGGVAVGLGLTRQDRALPGHLARHLASITGRGVDLHISAWLGMTLRDARAETDRRDLSRYDAILLTLGSADAVARLSADDWRAGLEPLLVGLLNRSAHRARIVVVGADTSSWSPYLNSFITGSTARRLDEFNRISRELCWALPRTSYLAPAAKRSSATTQYSVLDYDRAGRTVAAHLSHRLARQPPPTDDLGTPELAAGPPTLEALGLLDHTHDAVIDRVVTRTRSAFGVHGATLTVLEPGEVWCQSTAGPQEQDAASRPVSLHAATAARRGGLAIPDLGNDARFRDSPLASRHRMAFYAGYPVYAPTGECVAVLTIFDPQPRTFSPQEMTVLRNHALLVQDVLAAPVSRSSPGRRERSPRGENPTARPTIRAARHA